MLGYNFHYQNILFSYLDRGENVSPRKKSNSKSPSRKNSFVTNLNQENNGDFSPLLSHVNKNSIIKNSTDYMTSSMGTFTNPLMFQMDETNKRILTPWQEKMNKIYGFFLFFFFFFFWGLLA